MVAARRGHSRTRPERRSGSRGAARAADDLELRNRAPRTRAKMVERSWARDAVVLTTLGLSVVGCGRRGFVPDAAALGGPADAASPDAFSLPGVDASLDANSPDPSYAPDAVVTVDALPARDAPADAFAPSDGAYEETRSYIAKRVTRTTRRSQTAISSSAQARGRSEQEPRVQAHGLRGNAMDQEARGGPASASLHRRER